MGRAAMNVDHERGQPGRCGGGNAIQYRDAIASDLPAIVHLLADDDLGRTRNAGFEDQADAYRRAFDDILADPRNGYVVACRGTEVVGCYQLTYIRGLSFNGGLRAQIESVRVAASLRGRGFGAAMMRDAIARARTRGAFLVQLTTDRRRSHTKRFYERLGFVASHDGMKIRLD